MFLLPHSQPIVLTKLFALPLKKLHEGTGLHVPMAKNNNKKDHFSSGQVSMALDIPTTVPLQLKG